ncbi:hypothetical protein VC83_04897 [Pseudogymnoascus destructans]|nr:uncharacterized protein VC83_04897 [Pseudogymnoascus destructans]OAF58478.1 hypothetical protein VC83_04897 [Pseudogymnoascus destructans]
MRGRGRETYDDGGIDSDNGKGAQQDNIASSGIGPNQGIADILCTQYPEHKNISIGDPETGYLFKKDANGRIVKISNFPGMSRISGQKAVEATGKEWISFPQSILDTAKALESLNGGATWLSDGTANADIDHYQIQDLNEEL